VEMMFQTSGNWAKIFKKYSMEGFLRTKILNFRFGGHFINVTISYIHAKLYIIRMIFNQVVAAKRLNFGYISTKQDLATI